METEILIDSIRRYIRLNTLPRALSSELVDAAEKALGFGLPFVLRRLYLDIGNGGFGPQDGILPLMPTADLAMGRFAITEYRRFLDMNSSSFVWYERVLPFCSWGSGIFSCVDLFSDPKLADPFIFRFEPNMTDGETRENPNCVPFIGTGLFPEKVTLTQWLNDWIQGREEEMFERMNYI